MAITNLPAALLCTYQALGIDRILLATDYPYEDSSECIRFLEELPITPEDREKIYHRNAERVGILRKLPRGELAGQVQPP